jgi:hypothetical protein
MYGYSILFLPLLIQKAIGDGGIASCQMSEYRFVERRAKAIEYCQA